MNMSDNNSGPIRSTQPPLEDKLASLFNHPEGKAWHSVITALRGIDFPTYRQMIEAEMNWGKSLCSRSIK